MKKIILLFILLTLVVINIEVAEGSKTHATFKTQGVEENDSQNREVKFKKELLLLVRELQKTIDLDYINSPETCIKKAKDGEFNLRKNRYYLRPRKSVYKVAQVLTDEVLYFDSSDELPPIILDAKLNDRVYIEGQELQYGAELFQYVGIENYITPLEISQQAFVFHPVANKKIKDLILEYKDVSK
ncbi:MAG: hypothetical protein AMJ43_04100 [Coxiella sp. DG_40]|nr:MAG: hypothetical protein AMJ43_04100 [Coxiella sp. DG_40]